MSDLTIFHMTAVWLALGAVGLAAYYVLLSRLVRRLASTQPAVWESLGRPGPYEVVGGPKAGRLMGWVIGRSYLGLDNDTVVLGTRCRRTFLGLVVIVAGLIAVVVFWQLRMRRGV